MAYTLKALVGHPETIQALVAQLETASVVQLSQDVAMLPLTRAVVETLSKTAPADTEHPYENDKLYVSHAVIAFAVAGSNTGPVGYIEAEFFGGVGTQGGIIWEKGNMVYGPTVHGNEHGMEVVPGADWPINTILRWFGVVADEGKDEFRTVGLGRHRSTEEWTSDDED